MVEKGWEDAKWDGVKLELGCHWSVAGENVTAQSANITTCEILHFHDDDDRAIAVFLCIHRRQSKAMIDQRH